MKPSHASPPPQSACADCAFWELRYRVALRLGERLTRRIPETDLRERVLLHVAARWQRRLDCGLPPDGFDRFLDVYLAWVDFRMDRAATDLDRERRRVWRQYAHELPPGPARDAAPRADDDEPATWFAAISARRARSR